MKITAICQCGASYQVDAELVGRKGRCKACGATFAISAPAIPDSVPDDEAKPIPVLEPVSDSEATDSVQAQLDSLRRRCRGLMWAAAVAGVLAAIAGSLAAVAILRPTTVQFDDEKPVFIPRLAVNNLAVLDENEKPRIMLQFQPTTGLVRQDFLDLNGTRWISQSLDSKGYAAMYFSREDDSLSFLIEAYDTGQTEQVLLDRDGVSRISLETTPDGIANISLKDRSEKNRILMNTRPSPFEGGMFLYDKTGEMTWGSLIQQLKAETPSESQ